jgi:hypothetical protein
MYINADRLDGTTLIRKGKRQEVFKVTIGIAIRPHRDAVIISVPGDFRNTWAGWIEFIRPLDPLCRARRSSRDSKFDFPLPVI